jgi:hypothetical protein
MTSPFIDRNAPSLREGLQPRPQDLPHGLIAPPPAVREQVENERPKYRPKAFAQAEESLLNLWTVLYYFDYLGHEVIYRQTPQGPDVLAVGEQETIALKKTLPLAEQLLLQTYLGY